MTTKTTTIATITYSVWHGGPTDGRMVEQHREERFAGRRTLRGCQLALSRAHNAATRGGAYGTQPRTRPVVTSIRYE